MKTLLKVCKIILIVFAVIIVIGIIGAAFTGNDSKEEATQTEQTEEPTEVKEFTVEHDQEYIDTRDYIWNFLIDKGYDVETIVGVPNIGKKDVELGESYEGWYAFVKFNGEWKEFSVVLFNGEVSAIQPVS